jgi:hypothetical protein
MIAEIASDFDAELTNFNRFDLYSRFIDFVLSRDYQRSGATGAKPERRRAFLRTMAWRLRFELEKEAFRFGEISVALQQRLTEATTRQMVSGAIIDSKYGDNFYFSHRSFQEFLMAEYLLQEDISWDDLGMRINLLSDEVVDFVRECDDVEMLSHLFNSIEKGASIYWDRTLDWPAPGLVDTRLS